MAFIHASATGINLNLIVSVGRSPQPYVLNSKRVEERNSTQEEIYA